MRDNNDFNKYPLYPGESVDTNMDHRVGVNDTIIDTIPYNGSYIMTTDPVAESDEPSPGPEPVTQPNDEVWYDTYNKELLPVYTDLGLDYCHGKYGEQISSNMDYFNSNYGRTKWISSELLEQKYFNEEWNDHSPYTTGTTVYDSDLVFWKCIKNAPEGTPLQEGEYWEKYSNWDSQNSYIDGSEPDTNPSIVFHKGILWACTQSNTGMEPQDNSEYWTKYVTTITQMVSSEGFDENIKSLQFPVSMNRYMAHGADVQFYEFLYDEAEPFEFYPQDTIQYEYVYFIKFNTSAGIQYDELPYYVDPEYYGPILISVPEGSVATWQGCFTGNVIITDDPKYRQYTYEKYPAKEDIPWDELMQNNGE